MNWCAGENFEGVICNHCDGNIFDWFISDMVNKELHELEAALGCQLRLIWAGH